MYRRIPGSANLTPQSGTTDISIVLRCVAKCFTSLDCNFFRIQFDDHTSCSEYLKILLRNASLDPKESFFEAVNNDFSITGKEFSKLLARGNNIAMA